LLLNVVVLVVVVILVVVVVAVVVVAVVVVVVVRNGARVGGLNKTTVILSVAVAVAVVGTEINVYSDRQNRPAVWPFLAKKQVRFSLWRSNWQIKSYACNGVVIYLVFFLQFSGLYFAIIIDLLSCLLSATYEKLYEIIK